MVSQCSGIHIWYPSAWAAGALISENPIQGRGHPVESASTHMYIHVCITYNYLYTYGIPVLGQPALSFRENL